jgi:hypothetical protein
MALLQSIGRGLSSLGADLQRDRLERERQEQASLVRDEAREHTLRMNQQAEDQRLVALKESRAHALEVEDDRRAAQQRENDRVTAARQAISDKASDDAFARQQASFTRADAQWDAAGQAYQNLLTRGQFHRSDVALPDTLYNPGGSVGEDWAAIGRVGGSLPGSPETVTPRDIQDYHTEFDPRTGDPVGGRADPREAYRRAQAFLEDRPYVPPPNPNPNFDLLTQPRSLGPSPDHYSFDDPDQIGRIPGAYTPQIGRIPADTAMATSSQPPVVPGQPVVSREEFERARLSGLYTDEELARMSGGLFNPFGQSGR